MDNRDKNEPFVKRSVVDGAISISHTLNPLSKEDLETLVYTLASFAFLVKKGETVSITELIRRIESTYEVSERLQSSIDVLQRTFTSFH